MVSLVSQHSLEGEHRLWVAQATFDWVGWQHVRALAYLLLACCVRTGACSRSSTMPLPCTGAVASSRRVAAQPRISQAWVHTACALVGVIAPVIAMTAITSYYKI